MMNDSLNVVNKKAEKFKNVELLRFIMAWAIVGFHIVNAKVFDQYGLLFLKPYLMQGSSAVSMFFVMAFFFLVLTIKPKQSLWSFYKSKWLRMAPLIVAVSVVGYILHKCGYWEWNWSANIENCLMIHDWATAKHPSLGAFVHPAWFVAAYMLVGVFYVGLIKTIPTKFHPFILGILAYIAWRINILSGQLPKYGTILGHFNIARAFFCLGIGYALAHAYRNYTNTPPPYYVSLGRSLCYTLLELVLVTFIVICLFVGCVNILSLFLVIIAFASLFWLFITKSGYLSRFLDRDWCVFLGRYAYAIFIVHILVLKAASLIVLPHCKAWSIEHPWLVLSGIAAVTMMLAVLGYHWVETPIVRFFKNKRI